jgi:hypothetical protein
MSSKNPISFGFSVLFEIAAVVAIVSVLPRINLRPSVSANQSPLETLPLQTTDLRIQSPQPWTDNLRSVDQRSAQSSPPVIEATPASPQYVEQQLDRASQRLLNSVGGAVNQASQDWLRPLPQQAAPVGNGLPQSQAIGTGYAPDSTYLPPLQQSPLQQSRPQQPPPQQTAHKPARSPSGPSRTTEPRPWLRY